MQDSLVDHHVRMESLVSQLPSIDGANVLIIGPPAAGKTTLANLLSSDNHKTIHTDDYMRHGYKEALYVIMGDIDLVGPSKTIVEGMQGYRLLRKGVELGSYYPDIVIELHIKNCTMEARYEANRQGKNLQSVRSFIAMHDKILKDYHKMKNPHKPTWMTFQND